jgi:hypothetical protein
MATRQKNQCEIMCDSVTNVIQFQFKISFIVNLIVHFTKDYLQWQTIFNLLKFTTLSLADKILATRHFSEIFAM